VAYRHIGYQVTQTAYQISLDISGQVYFTQKYA